MSVVIKSSKKKWAASLSVAALGSIPFSVCLAFRVAHAAAHDGNKVALIGLLFLVLSAALVWAAIYSVVRWFKFGESKFELVSDTVGHGLAGTIYVPAQVKPKNGFEVVFSCMNIAEGGGADRSSIQPLVWQDSLRLSAPLWSSAGHASALPIAFEIPAHLRASDNANRSNRTAWTLRASAELDGLDYCSSFEIPILPMSEIESDAEPQDLDAIA